MVCLFGVPGLPVGSAAGRHNLTNFANANTYPYNRNRSAAALMRFYLENRDDVSIKKMQFVGFGACKAIRRASIERFAQLDLALSQPATILRRIERRLFEPVQRSQRRLH